MFCAIYSVIYMQNTYWHQQPLHDIKLKLNFLKIQIRYYIGCCPWNLILNFSVCSHLEQHEMIWKGCSHFVRKQEQERAASPAQKAWRVLLGSSQLELTALSTGALQQGT